MSAATVASSAPLPVNNSHSNNSSSAATAAANGLTLNLSSNNPFRNRAASPSQLSPPVASPASIDQTAQYRMSNNPFLDAGEAQSALNPAPKNNINVPSDIFNDLSLLDKPAAPVKPQGPPPAYAAQPGRPNGVLPPRGPPRPPGSPRSRAEQIRATRPRGMSETSVIEKERQDRKEREREQSDRPPRTESEERRRRERRKEREERHRREKEKGDRPRKSTRRPQGLDIIDQLDVTGVYGQGLFHHDGPFDACNPHRNSKRDRKAPMQAFPANSANMQLGGSGPLNAQIDLDRFHGRGEEAFGAFNSTRRADTMIVDPTTRVEAIHGEETYGLGTSTFLEGAPATRKEIQRKDSDERREELAAGGLGRKKSLAQKFRGMSNSGRAYRPTDLRSPDARFNGEVFDASPPPMGTNGQSVSAGGVARANGNAEYNPFDKDYEKDYEKKSTQFRVAEQEKIGGRARAPSSPQDGARGLVRTVTADSADAVRPGSNEGEGSKTGFLSRMKSLKGGKRTRPDRPEY